ELGVLQSLGIAAEPSAAAAFAAARRISRRYFTTTDSWGDTMLIINTGRGPALLPDSKAPVPQQSA
ncbi:MAG TPA: hypothetical protein VJB16_04580, partial [archaeon]|nr:hypothetical protein [archaeon]